MGQLWDKSQENVVGEKSEFNINFLLTSLYSSLKEVYFFLSNSARHTTINM